MTEGAGCSTCYLQMDLFLVEGRGNQAIGLLFVHFGHVPGGDALTAVGAEQGAVVERKVDSALDDSVIVHFHKVAFADLLVVGDELLAIGASDLEYMAAPDFFTIWIVIDSHLSPQ